MKSRSLMVQIHLILAAVFLPFMVLMPLSGTLYLLDIEGEQAKDVAFIVDGVPPLDKGAQEEFFREQFRKHAIDFEFEYIRATKTDFIFRPTSRVYYMASPDGETLTMYKVTPNLIRRLMEIHKGHGPRLIRSLEIAFGVSLLLVAFTGVWIGIVTPVYRRPMTIAFVIGVAIVVFAIV